MIRLGLVGYPLGHSLSPRIHAAALIECGLDGRYELHPIDPQDLDALRILLEHVRTGRILGLNVTIPHKQSVIPLLDELTSTAAEVGAVNTIHARDGILVGDNTDATGFLTDLKNFLAQDAPNVRRAALILGAGGSARAVIRALLDDGWHVTIAARRLEQARGLARRYNGVQVIEFEISGLQTTSAGLIVNTTPIGMAPNTDASPWPEDLPLPPDAAVYDLVYNPRETKLSKEARLQGLPARTGLGMLVEQAALAFEIWTGCHPSRTVLAQAVDH